MVVYYEKISNWQDENYEEIILKESVNITKAGTYHLTGTLEDGNITINVGDNDLVKLVLDNVNITCNNSSAINVENARKVIITVVEGSVNTLTDGENYSSEEEPDSTLFSKDTLVINGTGTLNINANYLDGIACKDGLKIIGTTINVNANDDGIRGKDYIGIKDANIIIKANSDGMKSTNDTEKGNILIEGNSSIEIEVGDDGIHAYNTINIDDGTVNIIKSYEGIEASNININGGNINIVASGMMQTPSNSSKIYTIFYVYTNTQEAGSTITIKNANGEEIISFTTSKTYNSVVVSSEKFEEGETYSIYSDDEKIEDITITNIVTSAGNSNEVIYLCSYKPFILVKS